MKALLLAAALTGIVDRIEGDQAVIEWSDEVRFGLLPLESLPREVGEGDAIRVRVRRGRRRLVVRTTSIERTKSVQPSRREHATP